MGDHQTCHPQNQMLPVRKWCLHLGPGRSEVQSFLGADCLLRLTPSHIPHPAMRHTACMGLGSHDILAPHAEPGSCCPLVFHLTSHQPPSQDAPGRALSQQEGQDLPAKGLAIRAWSFCIIRNEGFLGITATIAVPLPACNHGFQLSALTSPWGSLLVSGPQWGPLILQETFLFLLTWST